MRWNGKAALPAALVLAAACGGAGAAPRPFTMGSAPPAASAQASAGPSAQAVVPTPPASAPVVVTQIAAGGGVTCARLADKTVRCWGDNDFNVLSPAFSDDRAVRRPVPIPGLPPAAEVIVGAAHACARLEDGTVQCWGTDDGTLGLGSPLPPGPPPHTDRPMPVLGLGSVVSLSSHGHLCALLANKTVTCWHDYDSGNGDPRDAGSRVPVVVPGFANAVQISDGDTTSCALFATGKARCWRDVSPGLIPRGKVRVDPVEVPGVTDAIAISAGSTGGCIITKANTLRCWGEVAFTRAEGQQKTIAYAIPGLTNVVRVAVAYETVCVVLASGAVLCDKTDFRAAHAPVAVPGVTDAVEVALGYEHTCVLTKDGRVLCWGDNTFGQLGDGTATSRTMAAPVRF